jgi:hypothetical protein
MFDESEPASLKKSKYRSLETKMRYVWKKKAAGTLPLKEQL